MHCGLGECNQSDDSTGLLELLVIRLSHIDDTVTGLLDQIDFVSMVSVVRLMTHFTGLPDYH